MEKSQRHLIMAGVPVEKERGEGAVSAKSSRGSFSFEGGESMVESQRARLKQTSSADGGVPRRSVNVEVLKTTLAGGFAGMLAGGGIMLGALRLSPVARASRGARLAIATVSLCVPALAFAHTATTRKFGSPPPRWAVPAGARVQAVQNPPTPCE
ncbi:hypothetical protein EMIHUDRAFT_207435 [Emiliania huxleyi CCMP1516]|uniref:Uncharacterized protein n=2 Tax=Emiliania huxleyi TaxID=2903 RepID=A0A0D3JFG8_EMIH1|nr:hypothetical protein EMIHUDRAFT_207435 [Emiliania huxleyi CCMP1516]EOD22253.1 hypothetical protein EMIHUDRAFT_207435 [Emiliania huxleyi CCMP1516]|eukprot:XP_005774682.1 hypothetical protein EMIHUDRAFT_207435 [Emiliania huxleyi CCMP1516]